MRNSRLVFEPGVDFAADDEVGVLVSGGLDSCILVGVLLKRGVKVQPIHIESDLCWRCEEREAVDQFLQAVQSPRLAELVTLRMPVADLYQDHWSVTGRGFPSADSLDDAVYLPGRNALLLIKAALWCQLSGIQTLCLAALGTSPFADAGDAFLSRFESALNLSDSGPVRIVSPFSRMTKDDVMQLGRDFPLHFTFSCIAPVDGLHCGQCNKCAERRVAFQAACIPDTAGYARLVDLPA